MSDLVEVAAAEDLGPGERVIVSVEGHGIGVFNVDGEYYALSNVCAHEGGPVCTGKQQMDLAGEYEGPGKRVREYFDESRPVVACPWHGWEYDLATGEHLGDPSESIPTYDVTERDGTVYVEV